MLIPAYHIAILAALYAVEYFYRAWSLKERRFMYVGKAGGRLILATVYFWFTFAPAEADLRAPWVRWALFMYLTIDLFFVLLDHLMRLITKYKKPFLEWVDQYAKHP